VKLDSNVKDLLLDGSNFGEEANKYCYIPIFKSKFGSVDAKKTIASHWFIGNLFIKD